MVTAEMVSELANDIESRSGTLHFFISERRAKVGRCALLQMQGTRSTISFPLPEEKKSEHVTVNQWLLGRP
jgi:hypothetical protein